MRTILRSLLALCCAMMTLVVARGAGADALPPPGVQHLAIRLVAESSRPRAGSTVTLALDTRPQPGWHGYWQNPGDAGFPATLTWTLPNGASAGQAAYPVPGMLLIAGLMNYVYERPYAPLVELKVPAGLAAGTPLPVRLHASYLVCAASLCVPESADLSLDLVVGDGTLDHRAEFDGWRQAIPKPLGGTATWQVGKDGARIAIPYPASAPLADAYLFPVTTGAIDYAAPQRVTRDGDRLVVAVRPAAGAKGPIDGVLRIADGRGLAVHAVPGVVAGGDAAPEHRLGWSDAVVPFGLAVLGGLILNVMPCVFPILSLKALSLARSGTSASHARQEALAYTAGVVLVCVALGAAILVLRAGGATAGWAFQLQDPRTVAVLALLSAGIAFNLAGLFELPTPAVGNIAGANGQGWGGAFATGALAAIVATPCTGPFMGAALGAALVLPWFAALAVFAGLGIGLALPFIAIGFVPALRSRLPRPGAWMETARHVLSVPMFLTAIALGWVLGQEAGVDALAFVLVLALVLALVLWGVGGRQRKGFAIGLPLALGSAVVVALAVFALPRSAPHGPVMASATEQAFSETRLAELRAANKPVFAYFTADWCLTCKVNERGAIADAGVRRAFEKHGVVTLVGDWTNGDAALGRFIQAHNRAGVPLYLYYGPGAAEPQVLPQVLTPGTLEALAA
ncbi:MAG: protein-disulfide reductase DsbD family protein [Janthinobacterium lividum]